MPTRLVHASAELPTAAQSRRERVLARDPAVARIVALYALDANEVDPVDDELAQDLAESRRWPRGRASAGRCR